MLHSSDWSHSTKWFCACFLQQVLCCSGRTTRSSEVDWCDCRHECILNVTMSIVTTMTTVLHLDFENECEVFQFPLDKLLVFTVLLVLHGVAASSIIGLRAHVLVSVVSSFFKSSTSSISFFPYPRNFLTVLPIFVTLRQIVSLIHSRQ